MLWNFVSLYLIAGLERLAETAKGGIGDKFRIFGRGICILVWALCILYGVLLLDGGYLNTRLCLYVISVT